MSGITSVVTPLFTGTLGQAVLGTAIKSQFDRAQNKQQAQTNALELQQKTVAADLQKEVLQSRADQDNDDRLRKLRAGLATARAHFAAQGIDPDSGSAAALQERSIDDMVDDQQAADDDLNNRMTQLNQNLSSIAQRNLLERSQAKQKQLLGYLQSGLKTQF